MTHQAYTRDQVSQALNQAADEVLGEPEYEDSDVIRDQDMINLMVNLAMGFLEHPGKSKAEIIQENYSEDAETVLGWIGH